MKKICGFLLASMLLTQANAYFVDQHVNYQEELNVLRSFDIDSRYLRNKEFLEVKNAESKAYKKHLLRAVNEEYSNLVVLQDILKDQNVPTDMLYLAVIESGLKANSISKSGAAGIWQLVPSTARALGLKVGKGIDERLDPVASTKAAAKYLTKLKKEFGKWYLAILAYNCGDGALKKAIAKAGTDDIRVLLDPNKKYLGLETRSFLRKILITAQMGNDLNHIIDTDTKLFNNPNDMNIAKVNPVVLEPKTISKPTKKVTTKIVRNDKKITKALKNTKYKAKKGETLLTIANKFSVPLKDLMKANDKKTLKVATGEGLVIPR